MRRGRSPNAGGAGISGSSRNMRLWVKTRKTWHMASNTAPLGAPKGSHAAEDFLNFMEHGVDVIPAPRRGSARGLRCLRGDQKCPVRFNESQEKNPKVVLASFYSPNSLLLSGFFLEKKQLFGVYAGVCFFFL